MLLTEFELENAPPARTCPHLFRPAPRGLPTHLDWSRRLQGFSSQAGLPWQPLPVSTIASCSGPCRQPGNQATANALTTSFCDGAPIHTTPAHPAPSAGTTTTRRCTAESVPRSNDGCVAATVGTMHRRTPIYRCLNTRSPGGLQTQLERTTRSSPLSRVGDKLREPTKDGLHLADHPLLFQACPNQPTFRLGLILINRKDWVAPPNWTHDPGADASPQAPAWASPDRAGCERRRRKKALKKTGWRLARPWSPPMIRSRMASADISVCERQRT